MIRKTVVILGLFLAKVSFGGIEFHQKAGIGGAWQESMAGYAQYGARLNLFGTETYTFSLSAAPSLGSEIGRSDQSTMRPIGFMPLTLNYNWGMGSSYQCLRYKGYSVNLGIVPSTFASTSNDIIPQNVSIPFYAGVDYRLQTRNLRTFSIEAGVIVSQFDESYLSDLGAALTISYLFGLY